MIETRVFLVKKISTTLIIINDILKIFRAWHKMISDKCLGNFMYVSSSVEKYF